MSTIFRPGNSGLENRGGRDNEASAGRPLLGARGGGTTMELPGLPGFGGSGGGYDDWGDDDGYDDSDNEGGPVRLIPQ